MADLTGQSIGRYQILSRLGEGGMATVYRARDTRLDREVALKLIRVDQFAPAMMGHILARFEREAKSLARLSHPSIVTVHDYGEHDGAPYLVLEYCDGGDLRNRLSGLPMDWREAIGLILPVARALRYSHRQGVIHRDVKPSNVMFTGEGEPKLSDFGIAKILEDDNAATLTGTGVGIGTPGYMAPEQWTGETSPQSDQYGLGVVLYEMLAGHKPYEATTPGGIHEKLLTQPLPSPRQLVPTIPEAVESALLKALDKDPAMRYPDMASFIKEFEGLLQQTPVAEAKFVVVAAPPPPTDTYKTLDLVVPEEKPHPITPADWKTATDPLPKRKPVNWKMIIVGAAALVVLAGIIWGGMQLSKGSPAMPEPSRSPTQTATPTPTAAPVVINREKDSMVMAHVPAGEFLMGSDPAKDKDANDDEQPQHSVYLDEYWIDQTEVTNAQYAACVDAGKCTPLYNTGSYTHSNYFRNSVYMDFPVIYADWNQAKTYCEWRGARLPTEAEWEKAARGTDGRVYPWGNGSPSSNLLNYDDNIGDTTEVGSYEGGKSPYGMYDMAGNVWEWVNDWYDANYYQNSQTENPQGSESGTSRVLRGGSWFYGDYYVRSSSRYGSDPSNRVNYIGFRCASSAQPAATPAASTPEPTPTPVANALPEKITDEKGITMRLVPAGPFTMGSNSGNDNEKPAHTVTLDDYYMGVYEVTNAQYAACVDVGRCTQPHNTGSSTRSSYFRSSVYMNFPVIYVDWNQAKAYCEWRSARLPTEAEWEKAARGTDERTYPWGEGIDGSFANYNGTVGDTTEVGKYEKGKSPYGMYDMAGNVWEWVSDWYDVYPGNEISSSDYGTTYRVLRGGSWNVVSYVRSASRWPFAPDGNKYNYIGFRCARYANP
jgi:eukaryotic-like serine/threonine-protein kinase